MNFWQQKIFSIEKKERKCILFVKAYNETKECDGIHLYTPSEMFPMKGTSNSCRNNKTIKQIKSVTHVGKRIVLVLDNPSFHKQHDKRICKCIERLADCNIPSKEGSIPESK